MEINVSHRFVDKSIGCDIRESLNLSYSGTGKMHSAKQWKGSWIKASLKKISNI